MEHLVPWEKLEEQIRPYYFKWTRGRPPKRIQTMRRMYLPQIWFNLADDALEEQGKIMRGGSILDATIIEAPSSTKNSAKSRDPQMHQCKKGNEWHFGMKAHIGLDVYSGMVHSISTT
jgi:IS5 family transposase